MRTRVWLVVAALVAVAIFFRRAERDTDVAAVDETGPPAGVFVYDAAARFNESLVQNIDAIDSAITGIMAGNVAVLVFTIDKIRELQPTDELWAISLLGGSMFSCVAGYIVGFLVGPRNREGIAPRRLVPDLLARADEAISDAVADIVEATEKNLMVRILKRIAVVLSIAFLLAGGVVVALARLGGNVVH